MPLKIIIQSSLTLFFIFSLPTWSMEDTPQRSAPAAKASQKIVEKGQKSKIAGYETYIKCVYFGDIQQLTQSQFSIHQSRDDQEIGEILLQYYPQGGYYNTGGQTPTLRLRHIEIKNGFRREHHATRALETLFRQLRASPLLPKNTEIWLEYSSCYPYLEKLYTDFGFEGTQEPSFAETKVLRVNLHKTRFPYYSKMLQIKKLKKEASN